ncbi:MAG TPA: TRAP transporter substrate-binding protein, partial [Stellaceae bacterium]|nr:TRAP transporter substrate-binding protein [Stellaceae bacterium]
LGQARADTTLTLNVAMPRASSFFVGLYQPWAQAVEKASQGRIKVVMPAASLAPVARQWDMVTSGIADVAMTPDDFIRQRVKLPFLAEIPFLAPNSVAATVAIWRTQLKFFAPANEYKGVKLLGLWVNGGNTLMTKDRPVKSLDDLKGLKIWVSSPNLKSAIEAFGATPVPSQGSNDMFDFVSGGVVDGTVTGMGSLISFQLARYIKQITTFPGQLGYNVFSFFMNQTVYDRLSPADRAVIDQVSYETISRTAAEGFVEQDHKGDAAAKQYGITINPASPDFMAQLKPRIEFYKTEWFAAAKERGIDAEAAYDYFAATAQEIAAASAK